MSIEVSDIHKIYGEQHALDGVSFKINKGEIVGFLGPNGAGKSTMMKILTCFLPQSSGKAMVCDMDVAQESIAIRKRIGYLPEHNPLYPDMYVKEYLAFIAGVHKVSKKRVQTIIEKTGLEREQHKKLRQLSKGYKQRAGLAAALIHDPEVLILDEPTTGLDPNQLVEIRKLIKDIGKEKTVMLSTHIMQEVEVLCDRVIIINKGQIIADQDTKSLKEFSGGRIFIIEFDREFTRNELKKINGVNQVDAISGNKWKVKARPGVDIRSDVFHFAVEQKATVLEIKEEEQNLEKVFQGLTRN